MPLLCSLEYLAPLLQLHLGLHMLLALEQQRSGRTNGTERRYSTVRPRHREQSYHLGDRLTARFTGPLAGAGSGTHPLTAAQQRRQSIRITKVECTCHPVRASLGHRERVGSMEDSGVWDTLLKWGARERVALIAIDSPNTCWRDARRSLF